MEHSVEEMQMLIADLNDAQLISESWQTSKALSMSNNDFTNAYERLCYDLLSKWNDMLVEEITLRSNPDAQYQEMELVVESD